MLILTQLEIFANKACQKVHCNVLRSFPNLQSLKLDKFKLMFTTFTLPKLTAVKWEMMEGINTLSSLAEVMRCVPNLESFCLDGPGDSANDFSSEPVVFPLLDALLQLEIDFPFLDHSIHSLLRSNPHLPSLHHLILCICMSKPVDEGFFVRHGDVTALIRLTLRLKISLEGDEKEEILASFSVLRYL